MANIFDVAQYILQRQGSMTAMKLQKLSYYSQAWSLVWDGKPLFSERIEAWANGPVVPDLYRVHKGNFLLDKDFIQSGLINNLTNEEKETIDAVLKTYGDKTPSFLSELTHNEKPWKEAREGLALGERGNREITYASMAEFYESLL